ncbi:MAG: aspartyl/glutamyl-tRNA amidotransferase subunit C [Methanomassiliicoccaceae archaeon]|nr:aspartyl/glutamyl-tRNA amidotransferase subunit C [Methanomassiliicoccaceae archaeon]
MDLLTVKRVAGIAHIDLTEEELKLFENDLSEIFDLLKAVNNTPVEDPPCFDPADAYGALREDVPVVYGNADEMLKSMSMYNGFVRGPKIV